MRMKLSVLACVAGIGVTAAWGANAAGTARTKPHATVHASAQLVAEGKAVFDENCVACHQQGAVGLPGTAPSLVNKDLLSIASDRFLAQTIHDGRPDTPMPSFADVLKPDQIKAVIAYLRSFAKEPYRGDDIDAEAPSKGDVLLGQERFQEICSACHGPNGEGYSAGGSGTAIAKVGFLSKASDGFIRATIREGRSGTPMHGFTGSEGLARLSYQEIDGIIAYLRTMQGK